MPIRPLRESDIPILREIHAASGFSYNFPPIEMIAASAVLVDENDQPIQAAFAEKTICLHLLGTPGHPAARMQGIRQLHDALREQLKPLGYKTADAWLPPQIERVFGRRLIRSFGWLRNTWLSYSVKI